MSQQSITCPQCGRVSYHPQDILNQYCGNCHQFHAYMKKPTPAKSEWKTPPHPNWCWCERCKPTNKKGKKKNE